MLQRIRSGSRPRGQASAVMSRAASTRHAELEAMWDIISEDDLLQEPQLPGGYQRREEAAE